MLEPNPGGYWQKIFAFLFPFYSMCFYQASQLVNKCGEPEGVVLVSLFREQNDEPLLKFNILHRIVELIPRYKMKSNLILNLFAPVV